MAKTWDQHIVDKLARVEAERDKLKEALTAIIPMTDEIAKAPMTAERWAERIEDVARAALGEAEICGYCKGGTDENVTHCPVCEGETEND